MQVTKLQNKKRACGPWETACTLHDTGCVRALTIKLEAKHLELRLKGSRRTTKTITYEKLYWHLLQLEERTRRPPTK